MNFTRALDNLRCQTFCEDFTQNFENAAISKATFYVEKTNVLQTRLKVLLVKHKTSLRRARPANRRNSTQFTLFRMLCCAWWQLHAHQNVSKWQTQILFSNTKTKTVRMRFWHDIWTRPHDCSDTHATCVSFLNTTKQQPTRASCMPYTWWYEKDESVFNLAICIRSLTWITTKMKFFIML